MLQTLEFYRYFSLRPNKEQRAAFLSGPGVLVLVLIDSECDSRRSLLSWRSLRALWQMDPHDESKGENLNPVHQLPTRRRGSGPRWSPPSTVKSLCSFRAPAASICPPRCMQTSKRKKKHSVCFPLAESLCFTTVCSSEASVGVRVEQVQVQVRGSGSTAPAFTPPGDSEAAPGLPPPLRRQAAGDKWACCTLGRRCGSPAISADTCREADRQIHQGESHSWAAGRKATTQTPDQPQLDWDHTSVFHNVAHGTQQRNSGGSRVRLVSCLVLPFD